MKKLLGLVIVLGLAAVPAMAQKVAIDYSHEYDFDSVKTFQYVDTQESNVKGNRMMADRVVGMIKLCDRLIILPSRDQPKRTSGRDAHGD